jgi:diguanylate cyclase (GGDEF)-like protein
MKLLALVILASVGLSGEAFPQSESIDQLQLRVIALERAVQEQKQVAMRNGILAGAFVIGLVGFGLYRRRVDATYLAAQLRMTDPLTGLKNRQYVTQTIEGDCNVAIRRHRGTAADGQTAPMNSDLLFMMIDIDEFKAINDEHGHAAADRLLAQIAGVVRSTCRTADTVARWGGEEFLAILRFTNRETAAISAERIRMAVEQRVFDLGGGRTVGVTCSIGFAPYPLFSDRPDEVSWEQVVTLAEDALQRAKAAGRNTWVGADAAAYDAKRHATRETPGQFHTVTTRSESQPARP